MRRRRRRVVAVYGPISNLAYYVHLIFYRHKCLLSGDVCASNSMEDYNVCVMCIYYRRLRVQKKHNLTYYALNLF